MHRQTNIQRLGFCTPWTRCWGVSHIKCKTVAPTSKTAQRMRH